MQRYKAVETNSKSAHPYAAADKSFGRNRPEFPETMILAILCNIFWAPALIPSLGRSHPNFNTMCAWWSHTSLCRKQTHSVKSFACKSLHYNCASQKKRVQLTRLLNFKENFCLLRLQVGEQVSTTSPNLRGSTAPAPQKLGEQPMTLLPLFRRR